MKGYFVVEITLGKWKKSSKQTKMYVVCDKLDSYPMRLVKSKAAATKLPTRGVGCVVSDQFWEHYWKRFCERGLDLSTRAVVYVKSKKRKTTPMSMDEYEELT